MIQHGTGVKAMRNIFYKVPLKNFEIKKIEQLNRKLQVKNVQLPEWWCDRESLRCL